MQNDTNEDRNLLMEESEFTNLDWTTDDERMDMATANLFESLTFKTPKTREDARNNLKRHLRAVLIVFSRLAQFDPSQSLAYPRNNNIGTMSYKGNYQPYNPFNYNFKKIREVLDALESHGFVKCEVGKQDYFKGKYQGRVSRYIMLESLLDYLSHYELSDIQYAKKLLNDGIVIKKSVPGRKHKIVIRDYSSIIEPEDVVQSKSFLKQYNELISTADIAITHQESERPVNLRNCYTTRIFQDEDFTLDGRFYGGWWMQCEKNDRWYIAINNEQTVECDFRSNHLYLFYGLNGEAIPENLRSDPYAISEVYPRALIKLLITRYFNCAGEYGIINHIRSARGGFTDEKEKSLQLIREYLPDDNVCRKVMDIIFSSHPILRTATDYQWGLRLMNWDSKVALYVLQTMTDEGIPVLGIHDSFIAQRSSHERLKACMAQAYTYLGIPLAEPPIHTTYGHVHRNQEGLAVAHNIANPRYQRINPT